MFAFININIYLIYKEKTMIVHFVYMWLDKSRKMFYIGQHSGSYDDQYTTSSAWLAGEIKYRPQDFKRRIIKSFSTKNEAQIYEGYLLTLIKDSEWCKKYYNAKQGKPKGTKPWNAGKSNVYSQETLDKMSKAKLGNTATKGKKFPHLTKENNVMHKPEQRKRMSDLAKGRKKFIKPDGSWTWVYPTTSVTEQVGTDL